jgi:hypothetical protein
VTQPFEIFAPTPDPALEEVADTLLRADPRGECWAKVIRHTYDMIYNGQETMRYRWDQLMKTEKTHFGTLFEINAQRQFLFDGGDSTDYRISGHQVDAKWSQRMGGWMLPPEVFGELALLRQEAMRRPSGLWDSSESRTMCAGNVATGTRKASSTSSDASRFGGSGAMQPCVQTFCSNSHRATSTRFSRADMERSAQTSFSGAPRE